jgi:hypothetical protein
MVRQNRVAREHGLSFLLTSAQVRASVASGELVELAGNDDYEVAAFVSHPYVVPAVLTFVETFAADYRGACGQTLVVTSAVRPVSQQPRNAHELSVHPAGMAVDVRVSDRPSCRRWIEAELVALGERGVLSGIRERTPPHYHVAVYPMPYLAYLEERRAEERATLAASLLARGEVAREPMHAEAPPASSTGPVREDGEGAGGAGPLSLALTTLMGLVGGGLVLGARPGATWPSWLLRAPERITGRRRRRPAVGDRPERQRAAIAPAHASPEPRELPPTAERPPRPVRSA